MDYELKRGAASTRSVRARGGRGGKGGYTVVLVYGLGDSYIHGLNTRFIFFSSLECFLFFRLLLSLRLMLPFPFQERERERKL